MFRVTFKGEVEGEVELDRELNLLGAAVKANLPLKHRCGGHARCGTCILTVEQGMEQVSPVGNAEARVLKVLKAGEKQRLGCQAWAKGDVVCSTP